MYRPPPSLRSLALLCTGLFVVWLMLPYNLAWPLIALIVAIQSFRQDWHGQFVRSVRDGNW